MSALTNKLYFAYGSNMDATQMRDRCSDAKLEGVASIENRRFVINTRGVATIIWSSGSRVFGLLWIISEQDELSLDGYEGIKWGTYTKETITVERESGVMVEALVYVARDSAEGSPRSGYIEGIVAAAKANGIPDEFVEELMKWQQIDD